MPGFCHIKKFYHRFPATAVADSGYGSEENYRFMDETGMDAYVRYNRCHLEQRPRYKSNAFHHDHFRYNKEEDYYACPMRQHMSRISIRHDKTAGKRLPK